MKKFIAALAAAVIVFSCFPTFSGAFGFDPQEYEWHYSKMHIVEVQNDFCSYRDSLPETEHGERVFYYTHIFKGRTMTFMCESSLANLSDEEKEDWHYLGPRQCIKQYQILCPGSILPAGESINPLCVIDKLYMGDDSIPGMILEEDIYAGVCIASGEAKEKLMNMNTMSDDPDKNFYIGTPCRTFNDDTEYYANDRGYRFKHFADMYIPEVPSSDAGLYLTFTIPTRIVDGVSVLSNNECGPGRRVYKVIFEYEAAERNISEDERNDSLLRFNDLYGEVSIRSNLDIDEGYEYAELDTVIRYNDRIKTENESGAIISLRDRSSFYMQERSIVIVPEEPEQQNKFVILAGKTLVNLKHMMRGESIEVEVSQACAGIKGTTMAVEIDEETQAASFYLFTHAGTVLNKQTGEKTVLRAGEYAVVDGPETKKGTFDIEKKLEEYDPDHLGGPFFAYIDESTDGWTMPDDMADMDLRPEHTDKDFFKPDFGKKAHKQPGIALYLIIAGAAAAAVIIVICIVLAVRKRAAKAGTAPCCVPSADIREAEAIGENAGTETGIRDRKSGEHSFCTNCGRPVDPRANFCKYCGAKLSPDTESPENSKDTASGPRDGKDI